MRIDEVADATKIIKTKRATADKLYSEAAELRVKAQCVCMEADRLYKDISDIQKEIDIALAARRGKRRLGGESRFISRTGEWGKQR